MATENAQPALLTHSTAVARVMAEHGMRPSWAAGHSLGEFSAHVVAGSLSFADGVRLVRARGEAMAEAGRRTPGAMAAIIGLRTLRWRRFAPNSREPMKSLRRPTTTPRSGRDLRHADIR